MCETKYAELEMKEVFFFCYVSSRFFPPRLCRGCVVSSVGCRSQPPPPPSHFLFHLLPPQAPKRKRNGSKEVEGKGEKAEAVCKRSVDVPSSAVSVHIVWPCYSDGLDTAPLFGRRKILKSALFSPEKVI